MVHTRIIIEVTGETLRETIAERYDIPHTALHSVESSKAQTDGGSPGQSPDGRTLASQRVVDVPNDTLGLSSLLRFFPIP